MRSSSPREEFANDYAQSPQPGRLDVPELTRFFTEGFGFCVQERRGLCKFAVLTGENGFVLILMHDTRVNENTYPALFHVGFLVASSQAVNAAHQRITNLGYVSPAPAVSNRGGDRTFGFYCKAPGSVLVEVSAPA